MEGRRRGPVHLEVTGCQVVDEGGNGASLAEQGPVSLKLTAVTYGLGMTKEIFIGTLFLRSNLRQLCSQLVVPGLRQLGQLVDDAVVGDHGEVFLVPRYISDGKADGCEDLLIIPLFTF